MTYSPSQYAEALYDLIEAHPHKRTETVKKFAQKLVNDGKANQLRAIMAEFERIALEKKKLVLVKVESAKPHAVSAASLQKAVGEEIELIERVNPELGAGVSITIGDYRIDNTLKRRMEDLKAAFK